MKKRNHINPISVPKEYEHKVTKDNFEDVFETIYTTSFWKHADGSGSDSRPEIVPSFFTILTDIITEYSICDIGDFGCGTHYIFKDYKWPENISYTGYDASLTALERAKNNCKNSEFKFKHLSNYEQLPNHQLLLIKDVVCHWPLDLVQDFTNNHIQKFDYVLIAGATSITLSDDIEKKTSRQWFFKTAKDYDYGMWLFGNKK